MSMKTIRRERRPVAVFVLAAFSALLFLAAGPLPSSPKKGRDSAAVTQKGEAAGPGFIERPGRGSAAAKKRGKFPWWLAAAGGAVLAGVLVYFLVVKESDDEADDDGAGVRRVVLAEQFTATWCGYCPGAAMGLDQLKDENPDTFAVIAYHSTDEFYDSAIYNARRSYYGVSGIPDVFFDGVERVSGGNATQSMYPSYKPLYDRRAAILAPLEITVSGQGSGSVRVELRNVSGRRVDGTFHFLIVEDDIPYDWQNQHVLRFVCRQMLPGPAGETVGLEAGATTSLTRAFAIAAGWNRANCRIVAFVQGSNKEILQGVESGLPD
jgi:thiol-disulfide isomerase/thioredoxin